MPWGLVPGALGPLSLATPGTPRGARRVRGQKENARTVGCTFAVGRRGVLPVAEEAAWGKAPSGGV